MHLYAKVPVARYGVPLDVAKLAVFYARTMRLCHRSDLCGGRRNKLAHVAGLRLPVAKPLLRPSGLDTTGMLVIQSINRESSN